MWFKVYAFNGVSKMGDFDKDKQQFRRRDKHTVAPFPKLNPAVLAKTYATIADFYGIDDEERYEESEGRDIELEALAQSGNFAKLYAKILLRERPVPKTPERTEDVHGEWVEYLPGEEEALAEAAQGTPWCIADPGTGRNYLGYGSPNDGGYGEYSEGNNQAKFILFHLYDPDTATLAPNACAAIRLNPNGNIGEIRGLNEGQALEDSLVPIVEEKAKSLPGGEKYLEAFTDTKKLISLDHKMQNGEDLTKEELEFLYEINRPIKTLDTYTEYDPRIYELKNTYDIEYILDHGIDSNNLVSKLSAGTIVDNLDTLVKYGAKIDIDDLMSRLDPAEIAYSLNTLIKHGAKIDIDDLVSRLDGWQIRSYLDTLIEHGADQRLIDEKLHQQ